MESNRTIEIVQCLNCNSIVPKRLYCRKCGKVLLEVTTKTLSESSIKTEKHSSDEEQLLDANTKSLLNFAHKSAYEQLKTIRSETKGIEDYRLAGINANSQVDQKLLEQNDKIQISFNEENNISPSLILEKQVQMNPENAHEGYAPDLYVKEVVEKMVKSVKYEVNLVRLLQEGQMTEEIFIRLFHGLAYLTHGLISRRSESLNEIVSLLKGYESTILSAQQGMKLLDLRKSIGDASEEEFVVKSSALNWDIKNYGNKILESRNKSDYLKYIGNLFPEEELEELENMANKYSEDANLINVSKATRERINVAMQEASSILREAFT